MTDTVATGAGAAAGATPSFQELFDGLRATFDSGRTRSFAWRREQLGGLLGLLAENEDEIIAAVQEDLGRPLMEAWTAEIGAVRSEIAHLRKHFEKWSKPRRVNPGLNSMPGSAKIVPEPLGVALVISPWNYPVQLLLEPIASAIAAGNAVIGKPSELSPATSAVIARLAPKYLDESAVVLVEGAIAETTALLELPFDHIFFTGSTRVGSVVMEAAAKHLASVTLELGGKSPAIIAADANLDAAARRIAWGKFMNAGQTCVAPDYLLVDESIHDRFVDKLVRRISDSFGADPKASPDFGRIVNERHHARLVSLLADSGGTVLTGGEADESTRYFAPTLVSAPDLDSALMREEIFGPILPILPVNGTDEAVRFVNARPKPLALYVFSESGTIVDDVIARTSSGGVCVNHTIYHMVTPALPFGGVGPSGLGAYHGKFGYDVFTHHKPVLSKPSRPDPAIMYPPYKDLALRLAKKIF